MNSLVSKSGKGVLMAVAAIAGMLFTAGCGSSSNSITPLGGGFSASSLKGQYVMQQTGTGLNQTATSNDPFSETTVFTADGQGNLNILVDDFDQDGQQFIVALPETGTYTINSDGRGSLSFGEALYAITLIDDNHFYLIERDTFATSSGYGQTQDTSAFTAAPSGTFVFKAHNLDTSSRVGQMMISGGAVSGTEDFLSLGTLASTQAIASAVAMSAPSTTTGRGAFKLTDGTSFGYYVVNANEFYLMSNTSSLEIGQAETQTGGPFSAATLANSSSYVFGSSGDTNVSGSGGIHSAGVFISNGAGNTTGGAVDYVQDATLNSNLAVSGGTYTLASDGRGTLNLTLSGGVISPQIFWMVTGTRAYFLVNSTLAVEDGSFLLQQGAPFTGISSQAAFVMDGFDSAGFKDRVGNFQPAGSAGLNWNQTANSFNGSGVVSFLGTSGTYTVGSNGRVAAVVNGVTNSVVFYLSSPNTGFLVQEDADIGGVFAQQATQ